MITDIQKGEQEHQAFLLHGILQETTSLLEFIPLMVIQDHHRVEDIICQLDIFQGQEDINMKTPLQK